MLRFIIYVPVMGVLMMSLSGCLVTKAATTTAGIAIDTVGTTVDVATDAVGATSDLVFGDDEEEKDKKKKKKK